MAPTFPKASGTNAHPIDISTASDLRRHLADIDVSEPEIDALTDQFFHCTIKLEGVDTRAAKLMKTHIEALGGGLAMRKEADELTVRETDVIITGSRHTLRLLAARLKGEPFGLDGISEDISACIGRREPGHDLGKPHAGFRPYHLCHGNSQLHAGFILSRQQVDHDQGRAENSATR